LTTYLHDHSLRRPEGTYSDGTVNCEGDVDLSKAKLSSGVWLLGGLVQRPDIKQALKIIGGRPYPSTSSAEALDLSSLNLCGATAEDGRFEYAFFIGSNLRGGRFQRDYFDHAQFNDVNADDIKVADTSQPVTFTYSRMRCAVFSNGHFRGAAFNDADLEGASFNGSMLSGAYFASSNLRNVNFQGANLHNANFDGANMHNANFNGANMEGIKLDKDTDLTGADFRGVFGLSQDDVTKSGAKIDQKALGTVPSKAITGLGKSEVSPR
jgi:uncharacterized protein YjbI with pentapeptide repeats